MTIEETLAAWAENQRHYLETSHRKDPAGYTQRMAKIALRWKDCFEALMSHSEAGDPEIWRTLGNAHNTGRGTLINGEEAIRWYHRAAEVGDAKAMASLGCRLQRSDDPKRKSESVEWLLKAANLGDAGGMIWLGFAYREGDGVEVDYEKSAEWFTKAGEAGDEHSMIHVGRLFASYSFQPERAIEWLLRAAQAGQKESFNMLGFLYDELGSPVYDPVEAIKWWRVGAESEGASAARAALGLSWHYRSGIATPCDQTMALEWAKKAVELAPEKTMIFHEAVKFYKEVEQDLL